MEAWIAGMEVCLRRLLDVACNWRDEVSREGRRGGGTEEGGRGEGEREEGGRGEGGREEGGRGEERVERSYTYRGKGTVDTCLAM